jgi:ribosomal protein S18 acetylase RimI-like enzyme
VRSLREDEKVALFDFVNALPEMGLWGKKTRYLRTGYRGFMRFFKYLEAFQLRSSLVAEENGKIVGFAIAAYSPSWITELTKRYRCDIEKRAYILGIAFDEGKKDVLNKLTTRLASHFSRKGIKGLEYSSFGNVCLTTATDVLTPENVDSLIIFREASFKISECYYSMKLNVESFTPSNKHQKEGMSFRFGERSVEIVGKNEVLGKTTCAPVHVSKTSLGIYVKQAYRGNRVGTALMAETLSHLKNRGVKSVELGVDGNNLPALRLYRRFGFEVFATHFYIMMPC